MCRVRARQREQKEETRTKCQIERGRKRHTAAHRERRAEGVGVGQERLLGTGVCPFLSGDDDLGFCLLPTRTGPGAASTGFWLTEMNEIASLESLGSHPRAGS